MGDVKGTGVISSRRWIQQTYGAAIWAEILEGLSPEAAEMATTRFATAWCPMSQVDEVWRRLHVLSGEGEAEFASSMRSHGRFLAQDTLGTILKAVLTFAVTPNALFRMMPRVWRMYFRGIDVRVDTSELGDKRGVNTVQGANLYYLSPFTEGWMRYAFDRVGATQVQCSERAFAAGEVSADELVFTLSWS